MDMEQINECRMFLFSLIIELEFVFVFGSISICTNRYLRGGSSLFLNFKIEFPNSSELWVVVWSSYALREPRYFTWSLPNNINGKEIIWNVDSMGQICWRLKIYIKDRKKKRGKIAMHEYICKINEWIKNFIIFILVLFYFFLFSRIFFLPYFE